MERFAAEAVKDSNFEPANEADAPEEPVKPEPKAEVEPEPEESSEADTETESEEPEQAESKEDAEEGSEDEESTETGESLPPEVQASVDRRIGKEVAKTKAEKEAREALENKLRDLEVQLSELRESKPAETVVVKSDMPLAEVGDVRSLHAKKTEAQSLRDQVTDMLESVEDDPEMVEQKLRKAGVVLKDQTGEDDYSVKRMRRELRGLDSNLRKTIEQHIPQRETFLKSQSEMMAQIQQEVPELKNPTSERSKIFRSILEQIPEIKLNPKWPMFVAGQTLFVEAMAKAKQDAAGKTKPKTANAPKIPAKPKSSPVPTKAKDAEVLDLKKRMMGGDSEARIKLLEAMLQ
jgi:hypothetical protein